MSVIYGPELFSVGVDTNIDAYPSPADFTYRRGSGNDMFIQASTDDVRVNLFDAEVIVICTDQAIPPDDFRNQHVHCQYNQTASNSNGGVVARYSATALRGYVCNQNNTTDVYFYEDDNGFTNIAAVGRGLSGGSLLSQEFRVVGDATGSTLIASINSTEAVQFYDTTAPANGYPGMHDFRTTPDASPIHDQFSVSTIDGPVVMHVAITDGNAPVTSAIVNLPSGIKAGETLICQIRNALGGTITFPNEGNSSTGWIQLFEDGSDASNDTVAMAWRKADGSEGATMTVTFGTSGKFAAIVYRIADAADPTIIPPEFATLTTGADTLPDPGTVTPTGGTKKYLFLWFGSWEGEQTNPPVGVPTNYMFPYGANSLTAGATASNCQMASAQREFETSSENPGSWTLSAAATGWTATVVAVHPTTKVNPPTVVLSAVSRAANW